MHQQVCLARSSRTARQEGRDTNQLLRMRDHVEITLVVFNKAQTQITHKATLVWLGNDALRFTLHWLMRGY